MSRAAEPAGSAAAAVSERQFRDALARWASGVTVVTARHDGEPVGMTVASFASLSLDPPLVLACLARSAASHDALVGAPGFAVHVLSADQEDVSALFARSGVDKFASYPDERGPFDAPLLPVGVARLACARESALPGGDHTILLGRVVGVDLDDAEPLLYWNREYGRLAR